MSAAFYPSPVVSPICKKKQLLFTICATKQVFTFQQSGYPVTLMSKLIIDRKLSTQMIGYSVGTQRTALLVIIFSSCPGFVLDGGVL